MRAIFCAWNISRFTTHSNSASSCCVWATLSLNRKFQMIGCSDLQIKFSIYQLTIPLITHSIISKWIQFLEQVRWVIKICNVNRLQTTIRFRKLWTDIKEEHNAWSKPTRLIISDVAIICLEKRTPENKKSATKKKWSFLWSCVLKLVLSSSKSDENAPCSEHARLVICKVPAAVPGETKIEQAFFVFCFFGKTCKSYQNQCFWGCFFCSKSLVRVINPSILEESWCRAARWFISTVFNVDSPSWISQWTLSGIKILRITGRDLLLCWIVAFRTSNRVV